MGAIQKLTLNLSVETNLGAHIDISFECFATHNLLQEGLAVCDSTDESLLDARSIDLTLYSYFHKGFTRHRK